MKIDKRIDAPFLTKFVNNKTFLTHDELIASIVNEIGNILSTKLKQKFDDSTKTPYGYGVPDLQSLDSSAESLGGFKEKCCKAILAYEPRVSDVTISDCFIDYKTQMLHMQLTVFCTSISFFHNFSFHL